MTNPDPDAQGGTGTGQSAGTGEGQETGTTQDGGQSAGGTGAEGSTGQDAGGQSAPTVSRAEYDALVARLRAADQKRNETEQQLRQIRDKDMPALEKANRDLQEAQARAEAAEKKANEALVRAAFLENAKYKWKNPTTALKLVNLEGVQIDDDGKVTGMEAALDALAKSDPYLLEPKDAEENTSKGSTGVPGNGGRAGGKDDSLTGLASRIPALRTRGIGNKS